MYYTVYSTDEQQTAKNQLNCSVELFYTSEMKFCIIFALAFVAVLLFSSAVAAVNCYECQSERANCYKHTCDWGHFGCFKTVAFTGLASKFYIFLPSIFYQFVIKSAVLLKHATKCC